MSYPIRCHHCKQWIGESSRPMEWTGLFRDSYDVARHIAPPRDTWRCKCGWATVFRPQTATTGGDWQRVEVKRSA